MVEKSGVYSPVEGKVGLIPFFTRLYTSQVVGNGISEPSTNMSANCKLVVWSPIGSPYERDCYLQLMVEIIH